jgi:hypothetical protein
MKASRRGILVGALAVPTLAGLASWRWKHGSGGVLLHDPSLAAGRRFAAASDAAGRPSRAIEGDRIRFTRALVDRRPALLAGVSLQADAVLVGDVAREAGYLAAFELQGADRSCTALACAPGWEALARLATGAGPGWAEALAAWAAAPQAPEMPRLAGIPNAGDGARPLGWVFVPRA